MDDLARTWAEMSQWLFPSLWILLGALGFWRSRKLAGVLLIAAGSSALLFSVLFASGSSFTEGWETDSPMNVAFSYRPWGFLAANGLPALSNLALVLAVGALLRGKHEG